MSAVPRHEAAGGTATNLTLRIALGGAALGLAALVVAGVVVTMMLGGRLANAASCQGGASTTLPLAGGVIVAATVYSDTGGGAYGYGLAGHYPYAELGLHSAADNDRSHANRIGLALGLGKALAPLTKLEIVAPNGRSVVAEKRDIGMGGPPIDGHQRAIDLWTTTREALGLDSNWSGLVRISPGPNGQLSAETSALSENTEPLSGAAGVCPEGSVGVSGVNQQIVQIAQREVLYTETGGFCTKFGPCELWCALFVTWVWKQAGVKVPSIGFSGEIYKWASEHTHAYPPSARPQPGWAVLFGSGPADSNTSKHVGIVEKVLPNGQITIINGDFKRRVNGQEVHSVLRTGPCAPANAASYSAGGCMEPGPIYGYAAPA